MLVSITTNANQMSFRLTLEPVYGVNGSLTHIGRSKSDMVRRASKVKAAVLSPRWEQKLTRTVIYFFAKITHENSKSQNKGRSTQPMSVTYQTTSYINKEAIFTLRGSNQVAICFASGVYR